MPLALDLLGSLGEALSFAFGMFWEVAGSNPAPATRKARFAGPF
jgi:hypothetical protein